MWYKRISIVMVILLATYCGWALVRPLPNLTPIIYSDPIPTPLIKSPVPTLNWSTHGSQAVGVEGYGVLATHGSQKPRPTASVAKVMVALAVLNKKPLLPGQQGPHIPITAADVALYKNGQASNQSGVAVAKGEKITEYQMLQGLLIASGNNLAQTITNWAFGSQQAYLNYANNYAKTLGMAHSHFADASGLSANTTSTPSDLVLLGLAALKDPVIAQIASQASATLPVAGLIKNYNSLLSGKTVLNGIKTGNTIEAGGCFLFSANYGSRKAVGVILGAPYLANALTDAPKVMNSLLVSLQTDTVINSSQKIAYFKPPWTKQVDIHPAKNIAVVDIIGTSHKTKLLTQSITPPTKIDYEVGTISFAYQGVNYSSTLVTSQAIAGPSIVWKLTHPF